MKTHFIQCLIPLSACLWFLAGCSRDTPAATAQELPVEVMVARTRPVAEKITASGSVESLNKSDLAFLVPGRIQSMDIEDGVEVKQGQILARIDPSDYEQALAAAEARLAEVRNRHERLARLFELGSLTITDFEKIDAALKEATAAAELARRQLGYAALQAPFDGIVTKHGASVGVVVAPGIPVCTVQALSPVRIRASVADADAATIAVGQHVEVVIPALGKQVHTAKVAALLPQADPLTRSFTVRIEFESQAGGARPGSIAIAHIHTGRLHDAITIPPQAVQKFADGSLYVWIVDPARKTAVRQVIETGALSAPGVQIVSGLKDGDLVVLQVPHTLFEGTLLKPVQKP